MILANTETCIVDISMVLHGTTKQNVVWKYAFALALDSNLAGLWCKSTEGLISCSSTFHHPVVCSAKFLGVRLPPGLPQSCLP